jgi:hypothetical protein
MKKNILLYVTLSMSILLMLFLNSAYAEISGDVNNAAELGLSRMLGSIPQGYELQYGFANREEFAIATVGIPYQMYTIHPDMMKDNVTVTDDMITSVEEWRFPVICNGSIRALLTVAKVKGQWQAVDIGAATLASEIDRLEKGLSLKTRDINRIILRLYQINSDFIVITEGSEKITNGSFYPVKSSRIGFGGSQTIELKLSPSTFQDLLPGLRDRYKNEYHP